MNESKNGSAIVAVIVAAIVIVGLLIVLLIALSPDDGELSRIDAAELVYFRVGPTLVCSHESCPVNVEWLVRANGDNPTVAVTIRRSSDPVESRVLLSNALEDSIVLTPESLAGVEIDGRPLIVAGGDEFAVVEIEVIGEQVGQIFQNGLVKWFGDEVRPQSFTGTGVLFGEELETGVFSETFFLVEDEFADLVFLNDRTISTGVSICGKHFWLRELEVAVPVLVGTSQAQRYDLVIESLEEGILFDGSNLEERYVFVPEEDLVIGAGITARITVRRNETDDWTDEQMRFGFFSELECFGFD